MASVLTKSSSVTCAKQGKATLKSNAKLNVAGAPVLLKADATSWSISGCTLMTGNSNTPCSTLASVSGGVAAKLTSDGSAVLLSSFAATTTAPPTAHTASASNAQSKMTAS